MATYETPPDSFTTPTRYRVTPARPTSERPGSSTTWTPAGSRATSGGTNAAIVRHLLLARVPDTEATADVEDLRPPAELGLDALAERHEPVDGDEALVDAGELRADVEVDAGDVEAGRAGGRDRGDGGVRREAELRLVVRRLDRLVRDRLDARGEADEDAPYAGGRRAGRLVGCVEDDGRAGLAGRAQLVVRLVVAVEEDPLARQAGRLRERELAERGDVGAEALLGEDAEERDVRERLRPVDDQGARRGLPVRARLGADVSSQ